MASHENDSESERKTRRCMAVSGIAPNVQSK